MTPPSPSSGPLSACCGKPVISKPMDQKGARWNVCAMCGQPCDLAPDNQDKETAFARWLTNHGCTPEELWKIQNCLGTCLGFEHPLATQAKEEWQRRDNQGGGTDQTSEER